MSNKFLTLIIGVIGTFIIGFSALFVVSETQQVLVLELGKPKEVIQKSGLNFKIPFFQTIQYFDKRILDYDARPQEVPTQDQKQLVVDAFARYRIIDPLQFFQTVQSEVGMNLRLDSMINAALREIIGDVDLQTVLTPKRAEIISDFAKLVAVKAKDFGIEVVDMRIRRIDLPEENSQAIYRRMQTQREQEARKIRAEGDKESRSIRARAEKEQRVIVADARKKAEILRGQGDSKAQAIYNDAYGLDAEFFDFWRSMQAMRKSLQSDNTTYVGPADGSFFRYFNKDFIAK